MDSLDAAGKTTILYQLHKGERVDTEPTLGFNVEVVEHNGVRMTVWDLGGQEKIRDCWRKYFSQAHGIIFVVDSADSQRFEEAKRELERMLDDQNVKGRRVPLLVFANKQDSPLAANAQHMAEVLNLSETDPSRPKFVQGANGQTGEGLKEGLNWLTQQLKENAAASSR